MAGPPLSLPERPVLSFTEQETDRLRQVYAGARVILEYGSGGSTVLAAEMPGKLIFSVESDRDWARNLQHYLDLQAAPSPAILHTVDIGPIGAWGRPVDTTHWQKFHTYPMSIWDQPFFRHPDAVLIDGRFRMACLAATRLRMTAPVTVLFDDYGPRKSYHQVEEVFGPPRMFGRMAEFKLRPDPLGDGDLSRLISYFSQASYVGNASYKA